jgi:predicted acetyltransferase
MYRRLRDDAGSIGSGVRPNILDHNAARRAVNAAAEKCISRKLNSFDQNICVKEKSEPMVGGTAP